VRLKRLITLSFSTPEATACDVGGGGGGGGGPLPPGVSCGE